MAQLDRFPSSTMRCFTTLETVFELSVPKGLELLSTPGMPEKIAEAITTHSIGSEYASSKGKAPAPKGPDVDLAIAGFLSTVVGSKQPRDLLVTQWPTSIGYLVSLFSTLSATDRIKDKTGVSEAAACTAAVALAKLHLAPKDPSSTQAPSSDVPPEKLTEALRSVLLSEADLDTKRPAVEGLALLTLQPPLKRLLVPTTPSTSETRLLVSALSTLDSSSSSSASSDLALSYGVASLLANLTARKRPTKGGEDEAVTERLRRMMASKAPSDQQRPQHEEEDPKLVDARCKVLLEAGIMLIVSTLSKSKGEQTRRSIGKVLLDLVERQEDRGQVLKGGGIRSLMAIIGSMHPIKQDGGKEASLDPADLPALQALAKLLITNDPLLILGPSASSPLTLSAIPPLIALLVHPSSSLLQVFESLMALTNLSSLGPETADRIAKSEPVMKKVESCMLEDHVLVRRAGTELVCNLVGNSATAWERYTGESTTGPGPDTPEGQKRIKTASGRLHLLTALTTVDDGRTRLASSGALAVVTESPLACLALLMRGGKVMGNLVSLASPAEAVEGQEGAAGMEEGLVLRGVEVLKNFANFAKGSGSREIMEKVKKAGVETALREVTGSKDLDAAIVDSATQALACFD